MTIILTPAEDHWAALSTTAQTRAPDALRAQMRAARDHFLTTGLPHRRTEGWRYADWRQMLGRSLNLASGHGQVQPTALSALPAHRIVIENGQFRPDLSDAPSGIVLTDYAAALSEGLIAPCDEAADGAASLHRALSAGGVVIEIADNAIWETPLHLDMRLSDPDAAAFATVVVQLGAGARATVYESLATAGQATGHLSTDVHYHLAAGAHLIRAGGDAYAPDATAWQRAIFHLEAAASVNSYSLIHGARGLRHEVQVNHRAAGAVARLYGALTLAPGRHANLNVLADHPVGPGQTVEQFHTLADSGAKAAFQGLIRVAPGADGVDARQYHHGLMLGEDAEINAKPDLEIFADDVQCAHGASCGALSADALYYLRARGMDEAEARALLTTAFVRTVFEGAPEEIKTALGGSDDL